MGKRDAGDGALYFDTSKEKWVGQIDAGIHPRTGKRRRVKVVQRKGESKTDLKRRLKTRMEELESSGNVETVGQLVEKWIGKGMPGSKKKSASTIAGLESFAGTHVIPVFGDVPLNAITVDDIEDFLEARADTHSKSTLIKLKGILSQSFDFGVARRYASWNPARQALLPKDAEQKRYPRALLDDERGWLIKVSSDHRLAAWVVVMSYMALRPGEAAGLCWDSVDFTAGTLTVRRTMLRDGTLKDGTKTGVSGMRTLAMPVEVVDALLRHREVQAAERQRVEDTGGLDDWPDEWANIVFVSEAGTPLMDSNMRRLVRYWADQAGINQTDQPVTPYDLRHTAATRLRERGATRDQLIDFLGHTDSRMVDRHYVHREQLTVSVAADLWNGEAS